MINLAEYSPTEVFECNDYIYAKNSEGRVLDLILKFTTDLRPPARLLDIGCGQGTIVRSLLEHRYEAFGVESRPVFPLDLQTVYLEDARRTHFPDDFFDAVIDRLVTAQLISINKRLDVAEEILKETARVAKPGGYFISSNSPLHLERIGLYQYFQGPIPANFGRYYNLYVLK